MKEGQRSYERISLVKQEGKLLLKSLLLAFANTCEILSLLSGGRYFGNFTVIPVESIYMLLSKILLVLSENVKG